MARRGRNRVRATQVTPRLRANESLCGAPDDAFVAQPPPALAFAVARDFMRFEVIKGAAEILPLAQDSDPGKSGLESVQDELFVKRAVVELRHAPLFVVIGYVERVGAGPGTADRRGVHRRRAALRLRAP